MLSYSLFSLSGHAILSEAKPYHSNYNDWLHRKIEAIFNRSKQRDLNNVIKQIAALNSKDDRLNHIEDANQPDGLQPDGLQR